MFPPIVDASVRARYGNYAAEVSVVDGLQLHLDSYTVPPKSHCYYGEAIQRLVGDRPHRRDRFGRSRKGDDATEHQGGHGGPHEAPRTDGGIGERHGSPSRSRGLSRASNFASIPATTAVRTASRAFQIGSRG